MMFAVVFAAVVAVASSQFSGFGQPSVQPFPRPVTSSPPRYSTPVAFVNRVVNSDQNANIVRYDNEIFPDGGYSYGFETDNGISAEARGTPRDFGGNPPIIPVVVQGSFGWTSPEGQPIGISYVADENGYQPTGDAIPTSPPIPDAILKALDFIARNPPAVQQKKK